jgi:hypothetical protein
VRFEGISLQGRGKSKPTVPMPNSMREHTYRRVKIMVH